ncbi:MAG: TolC family protein [Isosphaeraceae bacterium]
MTRHEARRRLAVAAALTLLGWLAGIPRTHAQSPTIESGGSAPPGAPGNRLGPAPGGESSLLGNAPGRVTGGAPNSPSDAPVSGRVGATGTRAPVSAVNPEPTIGPPPTVPGFGAPQPVNRFETPSYGTYAIPAGGDEEGPPEGLTLDQAIEMMLRANLDLRSKFVEIPQAEADILTAGLRANPIFYADAQLVPYGSYTKERPGGQTQYDINISYPLDLSGKRQARTLYATRAKRVVEAQYQDAVRLSIDQLYGVFLNVLAARQTVYYARAAVDGLKSLYNVTNELYRRDQATLADVKRIQVTLNAAEVGLDDASEALRKARHDLGTLLNLAPEQADALELRGSIRNQGVSIPPAEELIQIALAVRPDIISYRLGIGTAHANVRLQQANRFQDVYVLYQPYTFQDNGPIGLKSPTSWALGVTVPLPVYNRNQGNIARAKLNVTQTQIELARMERQVVNEVKQAVYEYDVTARMIDRIRNELEPAAREVRDKTYTLYVGGERNRVDYLNAQREYQDIVKRYLDTLIRHRRAMLALNTVVGQRLLP